MKNMLMNLTDNVLDLLYEVKFFRQKRHQMRCRVFLIYDNYNIEEYKGILTPDKKLMICYQLMRVQIRPIVYNFDNRNVCILPDGTHGRIDFKLLKGIAEAQKFDAFVKWQNLRRWVTTQVSSRGSIDFTLFSNEHSADLSADSFKMVQTTLLKEIFEAMHTTKLIMIVLASMAFGMFIGAIVSSVFHIIIAIFS